MDSEVPVFGSCAEQNPRAVLCAVGTPSSSAWQKPVADTEQGHVLMQVKEVRRHATRGPPPRITPPRGPHCMLHVPTVACFGSISNVTFLKEKAWPTHIHVALPR